MTTSSPIRFILAVAMIALSVGCQNATIKKDREGRVSVEGTLTNGGQPLHVEGREVQIGRVVLKFFELDENGQLVDNDPEAETDADADGNFSIPAGGLLPGTYRIAVHQYDPYPNVDKLKGRFDVKNSPIVRDVEGSTRLDIDLSNP